MIGVELMVMALQRQGVGTVFGIPGHLEPFFGAMEQGGVRLIHMRHEAAVLMAADGYARTKRGLGAACVTAGPGFANAVGGLASAYEACTPLIVFAGRNQLSLSDSGAIQEMDHTRIGRPITKWARTVHDASRLGEYVDTAARIALSGKPGPVLLEIPRDIAVHEVDEDLAARSLKPLRHPPKPRADAESIARAAELLVEAERPLILVGSGAYWGDAGDGLRRLAEEFRIPVMAKVLGRGLVPEDMEIGFSWALGYPAVKHADVVMVVGSRMNTSIAYGAPPHFAEDVRFIHIDIDAAEIGRNQYVEAPVVGDCGHAVGAIAQALEGRHNQARDTSWINDALEDRLSLIDTVGREETGQVHPLRMARELAPRMSDDAIFVGDGANSLNWHKAILKVKSPGGYMDHEPFGSMGVGVPMAIGAMAAQQETGGARPVFVGSGDGAFGQYVGELATASLHKLPIFVMIANDGTWSASRNITMRTFGGTYGVDMNQSRYDIVAQGLECHGELAATPAEVGPAFDRALEAVAEGRPAVVNVLVDRQSGELRAQDPRMQMVPFNNEWITQNARRPVRKDD